MTAFINAEDLKLEKLVYKYAYDKFNEILSVDSWDLEDLVEFAGTKLIEEDKESLIEEMKDFWNVDSLDQINPDDFKA